jgi:hypothetical protein
MQGKVLVELQVQRCTGFVVMLKHCILVFFGVWGPVYEFELPENELVLRQGSGFVTENEVDLTKVFVDVQVLNAETDKRLIDLILGECRVRFTPVKFSLVDYDHLRIKLKQSGHNQFYDLDHAHHIKWHE